MGSVANNQIVDNYYYRRLRKERAPQRPTRDERAERGGGGAGWIEDGGGGGVRMISTLYGWGSFVLWIGDDDGCHTLFFTAEFLDNRKLNVVYLPVPILLYCHSIPCIAFNGLLSAPWPWWRVSGAFA